MILANISAQTLGAFYQQIVASQEAAHGEHYCAHHDAIRRHASSLYAYAELGVNQGASLACAMLAGFETVIGIDRSFEPLREFEPLFLAEARERRTALYLWERDSREPIWAVDFLLIDSHHTAEHIREELAAHAGMVRRYILAHDTAKHPALHAELEKLEGWEVAERETRGVGYTLMRRVAPWR